MLTDDWAKSAHSSTNGCVEARLGDGMVQVRDTKHPDGPVLTFSAEDWRTFVAEVKAGRHDPA
jgi:hypothetical protein